MIWSTQTIPRTCQSQLLPRNLDTTLGNCTKLQNVQSSCQYTMAHTNNEIHCNYGHNSHPSFDTPTSLTVAFLFGIIGWGTSYNGSGVTAMNEPSMILLHAKYSNIHLLLHVFHHLGVLFLLAAMYIYLRKPWSSRALAIVLISQA